MSLHTILSLVSVASFITSISTASLPISDPNSPGTHNGLFQGPNHDSPTLQLIPTGSSTNLGVRPPETPFYYHVPNSPIALNCTSFFSDPQQDARLYDRLFDTLIGEFSDPREQDKQIWKPGTSNQFGWAADPPGPPPFRAAAIDLTVYRASMTVHDLAQALIGMNDVRNAYPKFDIEAYIVKNGEEADILGLLKVAYTDD